MPNEDFSDIPALDDVEGLQNFVNQQAVNQTVPDVQVPPMLQPNPAPTQTPDPNAGNSNPAPAQETPTYTREQVVQLLQSMNAQNQAQQIANQRAYQAQAQAQAQQARAAYTPQQAQAIKNLLDRGLSIEQINAALQRRNANVAQQVALEQRMQNLENYLQTQQYRADESAFINKMQTFGDKFGLSENDLVTFGQKAMGMGINLTQVNDVEAVFRAVYPEQYAIRSQRLAGSNASQIYGGASATEAPRAAASKLEDAYVDAFLKRSMPNQYGMYQQNK